MPFYIDQLKRTIELNQAPKKIISLVPSQTELLYHLGLNEEVIGITKFCVHPNEWFKSKTRIGGTKQLHIDKIKELQPDLIIANKEENVQEQIEELSKYFPVWISDVNNLKDAIEMINAVGEMTKKYEVAKSIVNSINKSFSPLQTRNLKLQTCYLIWQKPYMTIGGDTFISNMMQYAGFENIFAAKTRYPEVTIEDLHIADCRLLLLSSEPFPFTKKHIDDLQPFLPQTKIVLVDGEMFSWYGSRLIKAPAYFQQLQNEILSLNHAAGK
jgi:ABC-type Fe3+-hydroxamate transport system substrate-binding protein